MPTLKHVRSMLGLVVAGALSACAASSGIYALGPSTYIVREMRAEALGGGPVAQQAVLAEAAGFCQQQGRAMTVLTLEPGGDPRGFYWPTAFTATFRCGPAG